jgi:SAM-dependent methyltransferase
MVYLNPRLNELATRTFYNSDWTSLYNESKFGLDEEKLTEDDRLNLKNLEVVERLVRNKRGNLLEIGPGGRGTFLRAAKERGFRVHAVEINEDNVRSLKKILGNAVYDKELIEVGFESNTFDIVYMRDVFEHVLNPRPLLVEINRIMRSDGILSIEVPNIEGAIYKLVRENHTVVFGFEHVNYWSPETLRRILYLTGFTVVDMRHRSGDFRIPNLATYSLGQLTFTSVRRRKVGLPNRLFIGLIRRAVALRTGKFFDDMLPRLANSTKRGSVLNAIARKDAH